MLINNPKPPRPLLEVGADYDAKGGAHIIEMRRMPHYETCKDGKVHTDGCAKDKIEALYKGIVDVAERIRGVFATIQPSPK